MKRNLIQPILITSLSLSFPLPLLLSLPLISLSIIINLNHFIYPSLLLSSIDIDRYVVINKKLLQFFIKFKYYLVHYMAMANYQHYLQFNIDKMETKIY